MSNRVAWRQSAARHSQWAARPAPRQGPAGSVIGHAPARRARSCAVHAAEQSAVSTSEGVDSLKGRLYSMVGTKGGLDMGKADKDAVVTFVKQFKGKGRPDPEAMPLTGTSSGKFGPIIGTTSQWFPKDAPGKFKNAVSLFGGALRLELSAKHSTGKGHKVTVEFEKVNAFFAGIPIVEKPFPEGSKGFWNMLYADEGLRIFTTNQGNCFVMHNPDAGQKTYSNWRRFDKRALS